MSRPLLILGASVRAAAGSALWAGYAPVAGDLFADRDLSEQCVAERVSDYPRGLARFARQQPAMPWMYTGALENCPALVDEISRHRPLWGVPGSLLPRVRDPWQVADAVRAAGLNAPELAATPGDVPRQGAWLSKPRASCGGGRISIVGDPSAGNVPGAGPPDRYYQQRMDGTPCGAVYVAAAGRARLLGVTRQLIGSSWTGATGFQYAGSVGPLRLARPCVEQFRRLGDCLAAAFELVGLFGVDAVVRDDTVWPVEVNPRYPASVEILERALAIKAIAWHAAACCQGRLIDARPIVMNGNPWCGKAVVYATDEVVVCEEFSRRALSADAGPWPSCADVPQPGTRIAVGHPVLTVLAEDSSESRVERQLRARVAAVRESLAGYADPERWPG